MSLKSNQIGSCQEIALNCNKQAATLQCKELPYFFHCASPPCKKQKKVCPRKKIFLQNVTVSKISKLKPELFPSFCAALVS